jgi:RNA polymerase sigma-70 factor (ECF subfamily)
VIEPDLSVFKKMSGQAQMDWIVKHYMQDLYWVIRPIVKSHENTNDVLQNVLLKAYQNLPKFKYNSKLYSWLYRIAVNESLNFIKSESKKYATDIDDYQMQSLKSDTYYDGDDILLALESALLKLPPKQQEVFHLKYFNDMTYEQMSELLGTSVGALKASYHLAVKKIKEILT